MLTQRPHHPVEQGVVVTIDPEESLGVELLYPVKKHLSDGLYASFS
jgi:hypothetical protein